MRTNIFQKTASLIVLAVFGTNSVVWAGPKPELQTGKLLQEVVTRFDQARSVDQFLKGHEGLLTSKDVQTLKSKLGKFSQLKKTTGVGIKGNDLVVTVGTEKATIGVVDLMSYSFTINGKPWQFNPYQSLEANAESLQKTLSQHSALEKLWNILVADAHADGGLSLLVWAIIVLLAAIASAVIIPMFRRSGYMGISCTQIKDKNGEDSFTINVSWKNDGNTQKLLIDPTDPDSPKLKKDSELARIQGDDTICALDSDWKATSSCPTTLKLLPHLSKLKKMLDVCKDQDRLKNLNDLLNKGRTAPSKIEPILNEGGAGAD